MVISDQHRFAFVHIPKCAGTSVRKALQPIDDTVGMFDHIADHPFMGRINYGHITIADLARYFPDYYERVATFQSVAIVRDPEDRFFSAMFQRLREFKGYAQSQITDAVVYTESRAVIRHLESSIGRLDLEYVHFNRQSDYVFNDGVRVVQRVFALDQLASAAAYIAQCTGVRLVTTERENRTKALRITGLRPLVRALRAPYVSAVPHGLRHRIRAGLVRSGVYGEVESKSFTRSDPYVAGFLKDYYKSDFVLHAAARAG